MYFLVLFITATSHYGTYGAVWSTTVYNMPWFENPHAVKVDFYPRAAPLQVVRPKSPEDYENPVFKAHENDDEGHNLPLTPPSVPFTQQYNVNIEACGILTRSRTSSEPTTTSNTEGSRPNWAKRVNTRRGVDLPFSPVPNAAKRMSRALKSYWSGATTVPPTPPPKPELPVPENLNGGFIDCHRASYGHFPEDVPDIDLPIARTHMTEWVKAERAVLAH